MKQEMPDMTAFQQDPYVREYPETLPFWQAAEDGKFLLPRCAACGQCHWYPRAHCPLCGAADIGWCEASGRGTIFSYSVMRAGPAPYCLAYVALDEGPLLLSNIVDADLEALRIGQPVRVAFNRAATGRCMPVFAPAPSPGDTA